MTTPTRPPSPPRSLSPFLVVGATLILAGVVAVLAAVHVSRERDQMSRLLLEKAAALMRAFEAGARTGMMGGLGSGPRLQNLLEETARQPDIRYLAVTDTQGRILAHSDRRLLGQTFLPPEAFAALEPRQDEQWRLLDGQEPAFMAYRLFLPLGSPRGDHHGPGWGWRRGRPPPPGETPSLPGSPPSPPHAPPPPDCPAMPPPAEAPQMAGPGPAGGNATEFSCVEACDPTSGRPLDVRGLATVVFVGLDLAPFEEARQESLRNSLLLSAALLILAFAAMTSLFWANAVRTARRQLSDAKAIATEVVGNLPVGLVVSDGQGRMTFINQAALDLLRLRPDQCLRRPAAEVLPETLAQVLAGAAPEAPVAEAELQLTDPTGAPLPVAVGAAAIVSDEGRLVGRLLTLRDLRQVKRLEAQVRRGEKLAAIGRLAAGVAHEIRNPLSSIKGYAAYFGDKFASGSDDREAAAVMVREADRLNRVISELLEFARPMDLRLAPHPVQELVDHTLRLVRPDADHKTIHLATEGLAHCPPALVDPDRMAQALLNLYLNAIQAMAPGGTLSVRAGAEDQGHIFLEVSDTGPGIAPEDAARIFDPYFTTKATGTGLGLAIVHTIVEAHGGRISLRSQPGLGSAFRLLLPRAASARSHSPEEL